MTSMDEPRDFTKKPVTIKAIRFSKERPVPAMAVLNDADVEYDYVCSDVNIDTLECMGGTTEHELYIITLGGKMHVEDGDWIIRGVKGEFYPCKDDIFRETYDGVFD